MSVNDEITQQLFERVSCETTGYTRELMCSQHRHYYRYTVCPQTESEQTCQFKLSKDSDTNGYRDIFDIICKKVEHNMNEELSKKQEFMIKNLTTEEEDLFYTEGNHNVSVTMTTDTPIISSESIPHQNQFIEKPTLKCFCMKPVNIKKSKESRTCRCYPRRIGEKSIQKNRIRSERNKGNNSTMNVNHSKCIPNFIHDMKCTFKRNKKKGNTKFKGICVMSPVMHPFLSDLNCTGTNIVTFFESENGRYGTKFLTKENEKCLLNCVDPCVNHCEERTRRRGEIFIEKKQKELILEEKEEGKEKCSSGCTKSCAIFCHMEKPVRYKINTIYNILKEDTNRIVDTNQDYKENDTYMIISVNNNIGNSEKPINGNHNKLNIQDEYLVRTKFHSRMNALKEDSDFIDIIPSNRIENNSLVSLDNTLNGVSFCQIVKGFLSVAFISILIMVRNNKEIGIFVS